MVDANGLGMGAGVACGDAETGFAVPANGSIEDTVNWGTLPTGSYVGEALFDVNAPPNPTVSFVVQ